MSLRTISLSTAILCTVMAHTSFGQSGQKEDYDCQVTTESGTRGLVTYLTTSPEIAEKMVVGLEARTASGRIEIATSVVQCILRHSDQTFTDEGFEWWTTTLEE